MKYLNAKQKKSEKLLTFDIELKLLKIIYAHLKSFNILMHNTVLKLKNISAAAVAFNIQSLVFSLIILESI